MIPKWQELPEGPLRNQEMVEYIEKVLAPLFDAENFITTTRIQNYVKWGVMDPPKGRRYEKIHLAQAMVLTLLKTVLTTEEIAKGIRLQQLSIGTQEAYNAFCVALEDALEEVHVFEKQESKPLTLSPYPALSAACKAFAYTRFAREKIKNPRQ